MRTLKSTAGVAAICASAGFFAMSATVANAATVSDCLHAAREVRQAISHNQNSSEINDAKRQARTGLQYCNRGFYKRGTAHYAQALKLLGADGKTWGEASARP
jgi:6-phosphogluconate dehydrogenase